MSALPYLLVTTLKNRLISFFKKPANWVAALLITGMLGLVIFAGGADELGTLRPMNELYAIMSALYIAMFVLTAYQGVNRGATIFRLPDIHLVFPAPIEPRRVLLYGMVRQMGNSLMVGFFLLFQYAWMHQQYGVSIGFLLLVLLGYALSLFLGQVTAMVLYSAAAGKESLRKGIKSALFLLCGLAALYVAIPVSQNPNAWTLGASRAMGELPMILFPVGGWMRALIQGLWEGNGFMALTAGLAGVLLAGLGMLYLGRKQADYYEDVLQITEMNHQAITAKKEGRMQEMMPEHVKVGKTGINKGWGAAVFYQKHRLESRRGKRFVLDTMSLVMALVSIGFTLIIKDEGFIPAFAFATYMQLFTVATGRWVKELTRPYLYMIPETSFRKLMHCLRESLLGYVYEAVLLMVPIGLLTGLSPAGIAFAVVVRFTFACLFVAGNLLVEKLFGGIRLKSLVIMLYVLVMILLIAPGAALAILLAIKGIVFFSVEITSLGAMALSNLVLSPLVVFFCRNLLNNTEWVNQ